MPNEAAIPLVGRSIAAVRRVDNRIWYVLLIACFVAFAWRSSADISRAVVVLRTAGVWWLAAALVVALAMHLTFALVPTTILRGLAHRIPLPLAVRSYAERQTVSTVVPFGAASPLIMMPRQFGEYGVTSPTAALVFAINSIIGYSTFAALMIPVLLWMIADGEAPRLFELAAGVLLALVVIGLVLFARVMRGGSAPAWLRFIPIAEFGAYLASARSRRLARRSFALAAGLELFANLLGPVCLYLSLRAVHVHPSIGVVAAGWVVGTLFVLVSPVFEGLGLVELSMTITLQQFGVPAPAALGAALIYRAGEIWLPVLFGVAIEASRQKRLRGAPARIPALWTGLTGTLAVVSLMAPLYPHDLPRVRPGGFFKPVEFFRPDATTLWSITLAAGLLLLYLSYGLLRRQRLAWLCTVLLSAVLIGTHLKLSHDRGIAVLAAVNLLLLLIYRQRFRVRNDPPSLRVGLITLAVSASLALTYGVAGFWLATPREFGRDFNVTEAITDTLERYFTASNHNLHPRTRRADWFLDSFNVVGVVTVSVSVIALARPVIWRARTSALERFEARTLIEEAGDSSQDFFKYWPDKQFFFSEKRDAVVAYRTSNAVALVLGDPVGRTNAAFNAVLDEFIDFCDGNGWQVAFHQATPAHLGAYRSAGLIAMKIGGEAIVALAGFTLSGKSKKKKGLRVVLNRYEREGYRAVVHQAPLDDDLVAQLRAVSDEWLGISGRRERGFTLGQFSEAYVRQSTVIAVEAHDGRIEAFINLIPDGVPGELTFDMMRHRIDAPNGAMDFLMLKLIEYGRERGYERLSLGMVPFAEIGGGAEAPLRERALGLLTTRFERFFAATSLYNYKDKFDPEWEPRYLVYSSDASLPRIGLAIARLTEELPEPSLLATSM